jgi:DNA-binding beta-propeller fold protein YncE
VSNSTFGLGSGFISVIDETTGTVTATLTGFTTPEDMVLDPWRGKIYVNNYIDDGQGAVVSVIDEETNAITNITLPVPGDPKGIAIDPFRGKVYVGVQEGYATGDLVDTHYLAIIDEGSNTVVKTIQLPDMPEAVGVDPLRGIIYVANSVRGPYSVLAIDERNGKILANIPMPSQSQGFAVDADRGLLYVASDGYQFNGTYLGVVYNGVSTNGTVTVVDERTKTITDTIVTGPPSGSLKAVQSGWFSTPPTEPSTRRTFTVGPLSSSTLGRTK